MADKQFERVLYETGHKDRNLKGIAFAMGVPFSTLAEWINPNISGKQLKATDLPAFIEAADDDAPIRYLCALRNLTAVRIPMEGEPRDRKWLRHVARVSKETGEAVSSLADAAADGEMTDRERKSCIKEVREGIGALAELLVELESGLE